MVDGDIDTDALAFGQFVPSSTIDLDSNTNDGSDIGTITKVEIRAHGTEQTSVGLFNWTLEPDYIGGTGGNINIDDQDLSDSWTQYYDITTDINAPGTWAWSDVQALTVVVQCNYNSANFLNQCLMGLVEIRVTFT
jgi:hypothetical protein